MPTLKTVRLKSLKKTVGSGPNYLHKPHFSRPRFVKASQVTLKKLVERSNGDDMRQALHVSLASIKRRKAVRVKGRLFNQFQGRTTTDENGHRHTINVMYEGDTINKDTKVVVDCTCLSGDTKVLTDKGWQTIYDIAEPITSGKSVNYIVNGETRQGTAPYCSGQKYTWTMWLSNGQEIKATSDHKFLVKERVANHQQEGLPKDCKLVWKEFKDLNEGDKLVVENSRSLYSHYKPNVNQSYWEAYFVGFFWGDGTFYNTGFPTIRIASNVQRILKRLKKAGVVANVIDYNQNGDYSNTRIDLNVRATELLRRSWITREDRHSLPPQLSTDIDFFHGFMSGVIDAEGYVPKNEHGSSGQGVHIYGNHALDELSLLLVQYGYPSAKLKLLRSKGTSTNIGKSNHDSWSLSLNPFDSLALMKRCKTAKKYKPFKKPKDIFPIATIEAIKRRGGRQYVYDATVPEGARFVANGVIVHNCPRFAFFWEYALARKGAAFIYRCNGDPPIQTNPRYRISGCKHVIRVCAYILKHPKKFNNK